MAVLSAAEVREQAGLVYTRGTYYIALTNSTTNYTFQTIYSKVQADEVASGAGGYARLSYTYTTSDLQAFVTGQPLAKKIATFIHDGSSGIIDFNYVVLLREVAGVYSVVGFQSLGTNITLLAGQLVRININLLHGA